METLQYLILLLVAAGMFLLGRSEGARKERSKKPEPIQPICPCSHFASAHIEGKRCLGQVLRPFYLPHGARNGHEYVSCPCTVYQGPKVINDDFFHPGVIAP